jgi:hypothetical protein
MFTIDRIVHAFAGLLVLLSIPLACFVSVHFIWIAIFVGANLLQSGLTNWCLLSRILKAAGVPEGDHACGLRA